MPPSKYGRGCLLRFDIICRFSISPAAEYVAVDAARSAHDRLLCQCNITYVGHRDELENF